MTILTDDELKAVRERCAEVNDDILSVSADRRALLRHIDALHEQLATARKDAERYKVAKEFIAPRYLADQLNLPWTNIRKGQSIAEKIDELCDAAKGREETP